tara:strand:+ start:966 stop:3140 length:2175 start_codon:yes stop_codon:yes gene_type:complete
MPNYNKDVNSPSINYLNKDFTSLKKDLIEYAKTYFPDTYQDFNETSPGMMLLEMNAYVGDILSFYIDQQFKEMFVSTAEERTNLINLAKTLGYRVKPTSPSYVVLNFSQTVGVTGTAPNVSPDMSEALVLNKGMVLQSALSDVKFETLDVLDFTITGSYGGSMGYEPTIESTDSNGVPTEYKLKQDIIAVTGETKQKTFTVTSPTQFLRLTLPEKDVTSIISCIDSSGKNWHEVEYLAQDKVFTDTHYSDDDSRSSAYVDFTTGTAVNTTNPVPYVLNSMSKVNKRFIVETNPDNTTSIVFGNGLLNRDLSGSSVLEDVISDNNQINSLVQGTLPSSLDPSLGSKLDSLGETPANTTLTITYRTGGGSKTNVPANTIEQVLVRNVISSPSDSVLNTLRVTNDKPAGGGMDEESLGQIRERAKSHFASQNRAVTKKDYESRVISMPAKYGNISKVYVRRRPFTEITGSGGDTLYNQFDYDGDGQVTDSDISAFDTIFAGFSPGSNQDITQDQVSAIQNMRDLLTNAESLTTADVLSFKNIDIYVISNDGFNNFTATTDLIKSNLQKYLEQYKIISDNISIRDGFIINFGVFFRVVAKEHVNKSDLKLKCIDEIIRYFDNKNMQFNQTLYINDIQNLLYNVEGVKIVKDVKISQSGNLLKTGVNLYADGGTPPNLVGGAGTSEYGYAYEFEHADILSSGTIPPAHWTTPSIFELKNPKDNIKGEVE